MHPAMPFGELAGGVHVTRRVPPLRRRQSEPPATAPEWVRRRSLPLLPPDRRFVGDRGGVRTLGGRSNAACHMEDDAATCVARAFRVRIPNSVLPRRIQSPEKAGNETAMIRPPTER